MRFAMDLLSYIAVHGIRSYRRYVSPRKSFACAYRLHCGGASCSGFAETAIRRHGVWRGFLLLRRRWHICEQSHDLTRVRRRVIRKSTHQAGFCDDIIGLCVWLLFDAVINGLMHSAAACRDPFARKKKRHSDNGADSAEDV